MTVARIKATIFACTCDRCAHTWKAFALPERCAKCGRYTWNRADQRVGKGKFTVTKTRVTPAK